MFDDLLLDVHQALTTNEHGNTLAKAAAANWEIALIDEFQDTDPLQYEIFRQIFIEQGCPLFLVGDPKQAIYSFRGADIYAYLQAAQDADRHYTLAVNYRSHAKLINGISALFKQKNTPSSWKTSITAMSPPAAPKAGCRHTAPPSKCAGSIRTIKPAKRFCAAVPPNIAPMKLPLRSMKQPKAV
ncbi:exodeoxyribonuclease V, beta subunit [Neisseria flavescens]|nr:exodeoxyribonuclease V, beta subunit [Neisseria flavescens]